MAIKIYPTQLSKEAFAPFGDVIEATDSTEQRVINEGNTTRFHDLARLDLLQQGGKPTINIFRSTPLPTPLVLKAMERHPLSSQAFFPLGDTPYLIVVAPPGQLDVSSVRAFTASKDQGVNYHPGTWHHYSLALSLPSDFIVIDREADDENCDEVFLSEPEWIEIGVVEENGNVGD
jgi:ureidoglycolate lyase